MSCASLGPCLAGYVRVLRSEPGREEARKLATLAWPVILSMMTRFLINLIDIAVLGHLGTDELSGASLALIWITVTMVPLQRGFANAVNALCSQAHGAGKPQLALVWVKVAVIFITLLTLPLAASWLFTGARAAAD